MRFCDIPGHEDIKAHLRAQVDNGRLAHAILLQGPEGSAKFALARALAQYIHCTERHDGDSCGRCASCRQMQNFNHIDTIYSFPVVKRKAGSPSLSNDYIHEFTQFLGDSPWMDKDLWLSALDNPNTLPSIFVDEGAELMRRLSYTAHMSRHKVVLMWQPERMKEETANKMLKLVEEPFPDTVFIMTSDKSAEILPTIYSRVQRVNVPRYDDDTIIKFVQEKGVSDPQAASDIARLAQGNLVRALRLMSVEGENAQYFDWFVQLMRLAYQRDIAKLKQWSNTVAAEKRERQGRFLDYCSRFLRENFVYNLKDPKLILMTDKEHGFSANFARFITEKNVLGLVETFDTARIDVTANANSKIVFFDLSVSVILLLKQ